MKRLISTLTTVVAVGLSPAIDAAPLVIDFEGLPSMTMVPGFQVPANVRLSDQYLPTHGVLFSSESPYLAVVNMGIGHATSGALGVIGTDAQGNSSGTAPFFASFFDPSNPLTKAVTDFFSLRIDLWGNDNATPLTLVAYDVDGNQLASTSVPDTGGATLALSAAGIHSVKFIPNGTVGTDDFTFNSVTAVASIPEPPTYALVLISLFVLGVASRRMRLKTTLEK